MQLSLPASMCLLVPCQPPAGAAPCCTHSRVKGAAWWLVRILACVHNVTSARSSQRSQSWAVQQKRVRAGRCSTKLHSWQCTAVHIASSSSLYGGFEPRRQPPPHRTLVHFSPGGAVLLQHWRCACTNSLSVVCVCVCALRFFVSHACVFDACDRFMAWLCAVSLRRCCKPACCMGELN